jgi:8-oxo-dGTP pyrophosphatase MutT (NUDIX family)
MSADKKMTEPSPDDIRAALSSRVTRELPAAGCREAAVLIPLQLVDGRWQGLLTRRTRTVEHHKGEISFPGGRRDEADPDLRSTALRESEEEVGIPPTGVEVLGRLDDIYTISNYRIRPFVGRIPHPFTPRVQPAEIDELIILPLAGFLAPGCFAETVISRAGTPYSIYFFRVGGATVWGATGKIMKQFLEVGLDFSPSPPGAEVLSAMAGTLRQLPRRP